MSYLEKINSVNAQGQIVNPAQDESIILLRRIVKMLETSAIADAGGRQRITLDAITAALTLATVTTVGTVSTITAGTITTVGAVTSITNALPTGGNTIGNVTIGGMDDKQFIDIARTAYNTGIRQRLTFS